MPQQYYYIPILKSKQGEYGSLHELHADVKDHMIPLLEVLPFDPIVKEQDEKVPPTLTEHLEKKLVKSILKKWEEARPFFLDFHLLQQIANSLPSGVRPAQFVLDLLREKNFKAVPVTSINAHKDFQADVKQAVRRDGRGLMFRLQELDWYQDLDLVLGKQVPSYFELRPNQIDLLIDMEFIEMSSVEDRIRQITDLINTKIPSITDWRSVTIGGTSVPKHMGGIKKNSDDTKIPRREWQIWHRLWDSRDNLRRVPTFCDYSILHPELSDIDPKVMNMSAQIRYTLEDAILVLKGESLIKSKSGYQQHHLLSRLLVEKDEYKGKEFSWGDSYIFKCARKEETPGNRQTWRKIENCHHLTLVTEQLASFFAA
ncbi:MAG: beta family protein [Bacteroidota bacterium]